MAGFGTFNPNSNAQMGLQLLKSLKGGAATQGDMGAGGFIPRLLAGNPGGLIGMLMKGQQQPAAPSTNPADYAHLADAFGPGTPTMPAAAPGAPAPAAGGAAPGGMPNMGMLAALLQRMKPAPFGMDPNSGQPITADVAQGAGGGGPQLPLMGPNGW